MCVECWQPAIRGFSLHNAVAWTFVCALQGIWLAHKVEFSSVKDISRHQNSDSLKFALVTFEYKWKTTRSWLLSCIPLGRWLVRSSTLLRELHQNTCSLRNLLLLTLVLAHMTVSGHCLEHYWIKYAPTDWCRHEFLMIFHLLLAIQPTQIKQWKIIGPQSIIIIGTLALPRYYHYHLCNSSSLSSIFRLTLNN